MLALTRNSGPRSTHSPGAARGECVERIQPGLIIPTGKRKGQNPFAAGTRRALAEPRVRVTPAPPRQNHRTLASAIFAYRL